MKFLVSHYDDINQIPEIVDSYLNQQPVINFESIGMLEQLRENPQTFDGILECIVVSLNREIQIVTCRIRPHNILISHSKNRSSISTLTEYFIETEISIPGIYGPLVEVEQFTNIWKELSGEEFRTSDEFLQYSLNNLKISSHLIGDISTAKHEQKELLEGWTKESIREIIPDSTDEFVLSCTTSFLKLLNLNNVFVLTVENLPVSMAAISGQTKTMQAINDVYTPPEFRGKGFATELCVFLCDYILNDCKNTPVLWVKATNHAAIHIYEKIGFEKVAEMTLNLKQN